MGRVIVLAAIVWCAVVPATARAQEPVTLSGAITAALAANPQVRAAEAEADRAAAMSSGARAALFPQVSFAEAWQRSTQPVFGFSSLLAARRFTAADFAVDRLNAPGAVSAFASRLFVRQVLFDGQTRAAAARAAHQADAALAAAEAARADIALQVTEAYGRLLGAEAAGRAAASAVGAAEESLARAERRRDAGTVTDADVLALSVHLAAMRQREIQASGQAAVARAELNVLMNLPVTRPFEAVEPELPSGEVGDLESLLREAEARRPELRRAEAEREAAEAVLRAARGGWLPQVAAQAGVQFEGLSFARRADNWLIGGELTWQLSLGGGEQARTRAATAGIRAAEASVEAARNGVHIDVVAAVRYLETARARALAGRAAVESAAERERIIRNRYDAGLADVVAVLDAATARLDAEAERTAALIDSLIAHARLVRATGSPVNP